MKRVILGTLALFALAAPLKAHAYNVLKTSEHRELRWYSETIPFYINPDGFSDFEAEELISVTKRCMETWSALNFGLTFEFKGLTDVKAAEDDDLNVIFFEQDPERWSDTFRGQETALAMTRTWAVSSGAIQGFDLVFNDARYLFTNTDDPVLISTDFANTLTHELGHVLGLDHSGVDEAVMYTTSPQGETSKRTLTYDDREGISYLYRDGFPQAYACSFDPNRSSSRGALPSMLALALSSALIYSRRSRKP